MNKKIASILLLLVLLISVAAILIINGKPELTLEWTSQSKAVFKQYVKMIGFLSVMGLVFLRLRKSKLSQVEDENL